MESFKSSEKSGFLCLPHFLLLSWAKTVVRKCVYIKPHLGAGRHAGVWPIGELISRERSQESAFSKSFPGNHEVHWWLRPFGRTINQVKHSSFETRSWLLDCSIMGIMDLINKNAECPVKWAFLTHTVSVLLHTSVPWTVSVLFHLHPFLPGQTLLLSLLIPRGQKGTLSQSCLWRPFSCPVTVSRSLWGPYYWKKNFQDAFLRPFIRFLPCVLHVASTASTFIS